ncbi:MAG: phosphohistidine swiveling domain-containing protein [Gammaproteobacteria bacterium]|jgi:phosphohistidine swiveling domain-containing protein
MAKLFEDTDKYGYQSDFPIVEAYNSAMKDLVRKRFAASGKPWNDFVADSAYDDITNADIASIEERLLAYGYRFEPSAMSSAVERPEAYKDSGLYDVDFYFEHEDAPTAPVDSDGRELRGAGDNVVTRNENVLGTARYVRTSDKVLQYLTDGVPPDTVAIVDDSGGTLTAPILEKFKAVICAGGTTRSHLAILTREYGIPCFMNARLSAVKEGDKLELEAVAKAKSAEDYANGLDVSGKVWRIKT